VQGWLLPRLNPFIIWRCWPACLCQQLPGPACLSMPLPVGEPFNPFSLSILLACLPCPPPAVKISTGAQALDELLGGGVETKAVSEPCIAAPCCRLLLLSGLPGSAASCVHSESAGTLLQSQAAPACCTHPLSFPGPPLLPCRSPRCLGSGAPARRSCATRSASPHRWAARTAVGACCCPSACLPAEYALHVNALQSCVCLMMVAASSRVRCHAS